MKRLCYVTADSDPSGEWMEVETTSIFHAAINYCGACAGRSGGPPVPTGATIITVRVDGREYRVREGRVITVRVDGREYRVREGRVITVRVDRREYQVREGRVREWANAKAEQDAERRKAAEKKRGRA